MAEFFVGNIFLKFIDDGHTRERAAFGIERVFYQREYIFYIWQRFLIHYIERACNADFRGGGFIRINRLIKIINFQKENRTFFHIKKRGGIMMGGANQFYRGGYIFST